MPGIRLDQEHPPRHRKQRNKQWQARAVFTRSFHFIQLQHSPHVRTAGRALFHGAWARIDRPPSETSSDSESDPGNDRRNNIEYSDENEQETTEGRETAVGGVGGTEMGKKLQTQQEHGESEKRRRIAWPWQKVGQGGGGGSAGDTGGGGGKGGGNMAERKKVTEQTRKKEKKGKKSLKKRGTRAKTGSLPHGEGYVEFLDGWGVSQVGLR